MYSARRGFTLIELLVTISIIAILATIGATIFSNTQKEAQNSRRKADVVAIAKAMENKYSAVGGIYSALAKTDFAGGAIPLPPEGGTYASILGTGATGFRVCTSLVDNTQTQCTATAQGTCYCEESEQGAYVATGYVTPINDYGTPGGYSTPAYGTPAYGTPAYGTPAYGTPYATPPTATPTPTPGPQHFGLDTEGVNITNLPTTVFWATKFTMGAQGGNVTSISLYTGPTLPASPNNQVQMAIYTNTIIGGLNQPLNRVANTATGTLSANSWTTLSISATLSPNTIYWLVYNTNGGSDIAYNIVADQDELRWAAQSFGSWPATVGSIPSDQTSTAMISIYATYTP